MLKRLKQQGLTGMQLKYFAASLMVVDHIYQMFSIYHIPIWFKILGRIVAPIFLWMAAEGFYYTRNRQRYMLRMWGAFVGMRLMNMLLMKCFPVNHARLVNNIFGTILIAILLMQMYEWLKAQQWMRLYGTLSILSLLSLATLVSTMDSSWWMIGKLVSFVPNFVNIEGGMIFSVLGAGFYVLRQSLRLQSIWLMIIASVFVYQAVTLYGWQFEVLFTQQVQWFMVFAVIPMFFYNGKRGTGSRNFFYWFYPIHLYVLYLVAYGLQILSK